MNKDDATRDTELEEFNTNLPELAVPDEPKQLELIGDNELLDMYGEIMTNLRSDREEAGELADTFADMVVNDGDSSTSSKEALVNLVKAKIEASDKMTKIADLMTRIKLKQPDTYKPYMNKPGQGTTVNIYDQGGVNRRALMESIQKAKKGGDK